MKSNLIQEKSFEFAVLSLDLYKKLRSAQEDVLAKQFLRSSTSIGANVEEAIAGISKRDFIAKLAISLKEARETYYWLRVIEAGDFIQYDFALLKEEAQRLVRILSSIIKTCKERSEY